MPETDSASRIRAVGLRATKVRTAVLDALSRHGHLTAEEVFTSVKPDVPGTSLQAIYGVLWTFTEMGLARHLQPLGSPALFEARVGDNHHHLICTRCRRIEDIDCAVGQAPCLHPTDLHGFTLEQAEVTYWGLCATCHEEVVSQPHHS